MVMNVFASPDAGETDLSALTDPSITEISPEIKIDERQMNQSSGWRQVVSNSESRIENPFVSGSTSSSGDSSVKEYLGMGISLGAGYLNFGSGTTNSVNLDLNLNFVLGREFFPHNRFFLRADASILNSPVMRITPFAGAPSSSTVFMLEGGYTFSTEYISITAYFGGGILSFSSADNMHESSIAFKGGCELDFTIGMQETDGAAAPIHLIIPASCLFNANHYEISAGIGFAVTIEPGRTLWMTNLSQENTSSSQTPSVKEAEK